MRILVGTVEIGGVLPIFADGFRQLGHDVTTVISDRHRFNADIQYDVDLETNVIRWPSAISQTKSLPIRSLRAKVDRLARLERLIRLIARHDVFIFHWGGGSLRWYTDYPLIKALGKKIVSHFCGTDVRHWSTYDQVFAPLIAANSSVGLRDICPDLTSDPLDRPLSSMRIAERYSDLVLSVPNQSALAVRPYNHYLVPVDLSIYTGNIPGREVPVVVHAPSHSGVKGTDLIMSALEQLKSDGLKFEIRLLKEVSNRQILSEMADADVVIDQLHMPLHGKLGVEAMASGCALATCNREDYEPFPPNRPIWHIGVENVYLQLRQLLKNKNLRIDLANKGLSYVKQHHDHVHVVRRILQSLEAPGPERYDHYPDFFARQYRLPEGVVISDKLKRMTAQIVQRWGLPEEVDPQEMISRGLMSAEGLFSTQPIPRWPVAAQR